MVWSVFLTALIEAYVRLPQNSSGAIPLLGLEGQSLLTPLLLKASVSAVNWLRSEPCPSHCMALPFTKPLWPLRMAALINTIHCAPFYTRWGQKFSPQVLTVRAELWTCDLLEWEGRGGREQEGRKEVWERERGVGGGGGHLSSMQNGWIYSCMLTALQAQQKTPDSISLGEEPPDLFVVSLTVIPAP